MVGHQKGYKSFDHTALKPQPRMPFVDYVLVHRSAVASGSTESGSEAAAAAAASPERIARNARSEALRCLFEKQLQQEGFEINREVSGDFVYVALECPFWRLANEAERVHIEMPLKGKKLRSSGFSGCFGKFMRFIGHREEDDYICTDFEVAKGHLFEDFDLPDKFFRQSLRSLLVHIILTEIDISQCYNEDCADEDNYLTSMCGLPQLLHLGVYTDAFALHDPSANDGSSSVAIGLSGSYDEAGSSSSVLSSYEQSGESIDNCGGGRMCDARRKLDQRWPNVFKVQPMGLVREYFGEEIALYFAWSGLLSFSIFLPSLFGMAIFFYGLYLSLDGNGTDGAASEYTANFPSNASFSTLSHYTSPNYASQMTTPAYNATTLRSFPAILKNYAESALSTVQDALDNDITPWYSLLMCIWGTLFLELWKRRNAVLAYEWDVEHFESNEPDRPQFEGEAKKDVITGEVIKHYSGVKKFVKYVISVTVFILMVCVVFIISLSVITYRIFLRIDYCTVTTWNGTTRWDGVTCTVVTSLGATVLNAVAIMALGKLYELLAVKLTDWENHKTDTDYRDALIVKLFAFAFANSYTSLFYIAFFQNDKVYGDGGLFNRGYHYRETCGDSCMSMLSLQVLVLIIMKPLPKLLSDVVIPVVKKFVTKCKQRAGWYPYLAPNKDALLDYIIKESQKPQLGDFTLSEYTEKVIQYGYLMLFAVSLPLAPVIVLLTNVSDRYVDAKRMLWWYRRPIAKIAQDIGVWYYILQFLNISGVITNAFLIAFASKWGRSYLQDAASRLAFGLIYEHVVFALKFLLALAIPDVPGSVKEAMRRKHFLIKLVLKAEQPTGKHAKQQIDGSVRNGQQPSGAAARARKVSMLSKSEKKFSVTEV